jgi:chromosome transmission fidelity protein 1
MANLAEDRAERDFHHPYEPYDIQKQFMTALYDCIDAGKVGIFESPTGKDRGSLSLQAIVMTDTG